MIFFLAVIHKNNLLTLFSRPMLGYYLTNNSYLVAININKISPKNFKKLRRFFLTSELLILLGLIRFLSLKKLLKNPINYIYF